ncbi:MAG TPA: hypothetical protein VES73_08765 [Lamprocystis sp. (in: g-proteobacteria)]|nr:hypothetical protein [Lamprocystis sp. (in: g-proteobacteria)]
MPIPKTLAHQVAAAVRSVAQAGSTSLGRDCILHAQAAQHLLVGEGVANVQIVAGHAAWRVHPRHPSSVVSHHPAMYGGIVEPNGGGLLFHAWVACGDQVFDPTTYQFRQKMAELDAIDGGRTPVNWCPDYLLRSRKECVPWRSVRDGFRTGLFCYDPDQALTDRVRLELASGIDRHGATVLELAMQMAKSGQGFRVVGPCGRAVG